MQIILKRTFRITVLFLSAIVSSLIFVACQDDYEYEDKSPDFLGASIYDYLEENGNYTYFLRLINDLDYKEVLTKTGSKTLFPAKDEAFKRFFQDNPYNVRSYEELSYAQKRSIMNISMVNMAYLSYMLSNVAGTEGAAEGEALRHNTAYTYLDTIPFVKDDNFSENPYWSRFSGKGLYLLNDDSQVSLVHFTQPHMSLKGITKQDFSVFYNGLQYNENDIFINGIKVIEKDIICENGYIHVVEDVLLPSQNMAQIINTAEEISVFSQLMDKFSAPYYSDNATTAVRAFYDGSSAARPSLPGLDSVFVKRYFTTYQAYDPNYNLMTNYGLLYFDPAENKYAYQRDMGVMFVPTNNAMNEYINSEKGSYLKDAYGEWNNIPTPILALFIKNHQIRSFMSSLPNMWAKLTDESSFDMNIKEGDVSKTYMACNGAVYITNRVFPPIDYQCVYGSTLISEDTKIMNWALQDNSMKFYLYLRSMENMYNLIVPVDAALENYRDPVSWAKGVSSRQIWSFVYDPVKNLVYADLYNVDADGNKGTFIRRMGSSASDQNIIKNRLSDIIDMHIVIGEKSGDIMTGYINDGNTQYALTKGGTTLKINGSGEHVTMTGGGDIEQNTTPAEIFSNPSTGRKSIYDSDNGRTFFIDKVLQDPTKSVYTVLGEHSEYTMFFDLLKGNEVVFSYFQSHGDKDIVPIFDLKKTTSSSGLGYVVNSFNNFRYTVFVPTETALNKAFSEDDKLHTWDEIAAETDYDKKKEMTLYLLKFLKYHFMDNSAYISGKPINGMRYETAARNESSKFHRLVINSDGSNMAIECEGIDPGTGQPAKANVVKTAGLYNLMARDYIMEGSDYMTATTIAASSRSVIHLIDSVLKFE